MTILEIISDELNATAEPDAVIDDLAIDSLEYIELLHRLEQVFSIQIEEEDLKNVVTFKDLCEVVDKLRAAKQQSFDPRQNHSSLTEIEQKELKRRADFSG